MRISITHTSRYAYSEPAHYSIQALRMTPPSFSGQMVRSWTISAPGIESAIRFRDSFGNEAHLLTHTAKHSETVVVARGVVETEDRAGIVCGLPETAPLPVYRRQTVLTAPGEALQAFAAKVASVGEVESCHRLMSLVREAIAYEVGATSENTPAEAALISGKGVCQDHAHVFISAARRLGAPARYVSGYLFTNSDASTFAHHAWAEIWIDDLGWAGFDPTNGVCPTERYVRLTTGLDAVSAAPIRGIRRGSGNETLDVAVEVQQQSSQQ